MDKIQPTTATLSWVVLTQHHCQMLASAGIISKACLLTWLVADSGYWLGSQLGFQPEFLHVISPHGLGFFRARQPMEKKKNQTLPLEGRSVNKFADRF